MAKGQWDTYWLFVELGLTLTSANGTMGLVVPDSVVARQDSSRVREHVTARADRILVTPFGDAFDAGVSVVGLLLWRQSSFQAVEYAPRVGVIGCSLPGKITKIDAARLSEMLWTPPWSLAVLPHSNSRVSLASIARLSRGEELGKRDLLEKPEGVHDTPSVPVMSGSGLRELLSQPRPTHLVHPSLIKKLRANYGSPKIVIVKTGRTLRAAVDNLDLVTLQSVYNVQAIPCRHQNLTLKYICACLVSEPVQAMFILPHTAAKGLFPQITQAMLSHIVIPIPSDDILRDVESAFDAFVDGADGSMDVINRLFANAYQEIP